jgi:hypothetical protein
MSYQIIEITNKSTGAVASKYRGFFGGKHDTEEEANDICSILNYHRGDNVHYIVEQESNNER